MTMTPSELVGGYSRRVRAMLKLRGISACKAATLMGYPYTYSPPWLRGRAKPPLQVLPQLAAVLGCSPAWLLFGDGPWAGVQSDADLADAKTSSPPAIGWQP